MSKAAITSKNQLTLPRDVRHGLAVRAGDNVLFEPLEDGSFRVSALRAADWRAVAGSLSHLAAKRNAAPSVEEMDAAIGRHVAAEHRRISRR